MRSALTLYPVADAFTTQYVPGQNFGSAESLAVGSTAVTGGLKGYAWLRFDLPILPAGTTIRSAQLQLYLTQWGDDAAHTIDVYPATESWEESTIHWSNQPDWGALAAAEAVTPSNRYKSWNVQQLVQDWVAGASTNHGVVLRPAVMEICQLIFNSRDAQANRPLLVIEYAEPVSTPTDTPTATVTPSPTASATAVSTPTDTATATPSPTGTLFRVYLPVVVVGR